MNAKTHSEVRFHLARGKNYLKWQVKIVQNGGKLCEHYYDPTEYELELVGCRLVNRPGQAKRVFDAGVKSVTGWIKCDTVHVKNINRYDPVMVDDLEKLYYNPIKDIHWRRESDAGEFNWDYSEYAALVTQGRRVYILEERT
jgi:hypothetical protein